MASDIDELEHERVQGPSRLGWIIAVVVAAIVIAGAYIVFSGISEAGRIKATLSGHAGPVTEVEWSPDGKRLASSSYDSTVRVWDAASGKNTNTFQVKGLASSVAWSPDGKRLVVGSNLMQIWDIESGQVITTFTGPSEPIASVAWSQDGKDVAGAAGGLVYVWDVDTGQSAAIFNRHKGKVSSIAWSPNGQSIASASEDGTVRVWDALTTGNAVVLVSPTDGSVTNGLAWSPDGKSLACATTKTKIDIWDIPGGKLTRALEGHSNAVSSVTWSPDGKLVASGSADNTVKVWNVSTGQNTTTYTGPFWASKPVADVSWSPDGSTIAAATSTDIRLWKASP